MHDNGRGRARDSRKWTLVQRGRLGCWNGLESAAASLPKALHEPPSAKFRCPGPLNCPNYGTRQASLGRVSFAPPRANNNQATAPGEPGVSSLGHWTISHVRSLNAHHPPPRQSPVNPLRCMPCSLSDPSPSNPSSDVARLPLHLVDWPTTCVSGAAQQTNKTCGPPLKRPA